MSDYYDQNLFTVVESLVARMAALEAELARSRASLSIEESGLDGVPEEYLPTRDEIPPVYILEGNAIFRIYIRTVNNEARIFVDHVGYANIDAPTP